MNTNEIIKEVDSLTLSEKLLLVEDIWDQIAKDNDKLPLPEWQKIALDKRYQDYKNGNVELTDWETTHAELKEQYK